MQTKLGTFTSRKIEADMCAAIADQKQFDRDNTDVRIWFDTSKTPTEIRAVVSLHGSTIATYFYAKAFAPALLEVDEDVLRRYPTNTTISRLRALGADITVKRRIVYLNGEAITER